MYYKIFHMILSNGCFTRDSKQGPLLYIGGQIRWLSSANKGNTMPRLGGKQHIFNLKIRQDSCCGNCNEHLLFPTVS